MNFDTDTECLLLLIDHKLGNINLVLKEVQHIQHYKLA